MQPRSLATRTDLIFHRFGGTVTDRGEYLVIRTPGNPGYRWGNYLLFQDPPRPGDLGRWTELFAREVGTPPGTTHQVFAWDSPQGEPGAASEFQAARFRLDESVVLSAAPEDIVTPPRYNHEVVIRPLAGDREYEQAVEVAVAGRDPWADEEGYRDFSRRKFHEYRRMNAAGLGDWFGAFLGERLVAQCGLYQDGDLARYQAVDTHPDYRRRGICSTLIHQVALHGIERMGVNKLVIMADEHYFAKDIYQSVGFHRAERRVGLEKYPGLPVG